MSKWCAPGRLVLSAGAAALVVALSTAGCSSTTTNCTTEARASLVVTVLDASGARVCNASVTATDGSFSAPLPGTPGDDATCIYSGPTERAGTYTIVVHAGATTKRVEGIKVTADACHVHTRHVTITLDA